MLAAENMGHNNIEVQMTSVFIKRLQKFFLHIRKSQSRKGKKGKDEALSVGGTLGGHTLDKRYGKSFSSNSDPEVFGSDSDDDSDVFVSERYAVPEDKPDVSTNPFFCSDIEFDVEIEKISTSTTKKLQSALKLNRITSPMSMDEINHVIRQSGNNPGEL